MKPVSGEHHVLAFTQTFGRIRQGKRLIRRHIVRERLNAKLKQVKEPAL